MALFLHICLHVSSSGAVKTTLKLWVLLACMLYRILRSMLRTGRTTTKKTTWIIRLKSARNDFLFVSNFRQQWIVYSVADICGFYSCVHGGRKTLVWSFAWNSACQPSLPRRPSTQLDSTHILCCKKLRHKCLFMYAWELMWVSLLVPQNELFLLWSAECNASLCFYRNQIYNHVHPAAAFTLRQKNKSTPGLLCFAPGRDVSLWQ